MYLKDSLDVSIPVEDEPSGSQAHERRIRKPDESDSEQLQLQLNQSGPPVNVIVITETPTSVATRDESVALSASASAPLRLQPGLFERTVPVTLGSSSFKLMPRTTGPVVCSPSPSRARGLPGSRKRRAHSMSSLASSADDTAEEQHESPTYDSCGKEDFSSPRRSPIPTAENDLLKMNGLSLHSPIDKVEYVASPPKLPNQNISRPRASSFSVYNSSPGGSIQRNNSGSLSGSMGVRTPCTSNKSSPRHVPLTILSISSQQGPSPMKLPLVGRPPFHSGLSKMLHSLDGREDGDSMISSPRIPVASRSLMHPPTPLNNANSSAGAQMESPREHGTPRNNGGASFASASPRTPLPRVTLTPRTPLSGRRDLNSALPTFPSSCGDGLSFTPSPRHEDDDVDRMMDNILQGFTGHTPTPTNQTTAVSRRPLPVLNMVNPSSCNSLALSMGSPESIPALPQRLDHGRAPPRFLELSDCHRLTDELVPSNRSGVISFGQGFGLQPSVKTKSVMTPSRSGGHLSEIMKANAPVGAVDAETGSLSDSDDDEEFVLAFPMSAPSTSKKDHQSSIHHERRVKQRRHGSSSALELQNGHASMTSLTSNQASSTSLFGMDIVQEEGLSLASSTPRAMTPFSGQSSTQRKSFGSFGSLTRRDGEYGSSSSLTRGKSEVSLGSLGLCLEEPGGELGRELRTPPVCIQRPVSPPPLAKRCLLTHPNGPQATVSFSPADSKSVSLTIAQMVFHKD